MNKNYSKKAKVRYNVKRVRALVILLAFTAVLLIAEIYAWFTNQRNVSLNNLQGKVQVAEGLQISLDAKNWSSSINLGTEDANGQIIPSWTAYDAGIGNVTIKDDEEKMKALRHIIVKNLNVSETEKYINSLCEKKKNKKSTKYFVKDVKLFINTFEHAVSVMNDSGIGAIASVTESEENIVYSVSIPKSSAYCRRADIRGTDPAYSACAPSVI